MFKWPHGAAVIAVAMIALAWGTPASATLSFENTLSTANSDEAVGTKDWADGGFVLDQSVDCTDTECAYINEVTANRKEVSNFILGVTPDVFTQENILAGTTIGWELGTFCSGPSAGVPDGECIYGVKWDIGSLNATVTLVSDLLPANVDFAAIDGKTDKEDVQAHNASFGECNFDLIVTSPQTGCAIGPDGTPVGDDIPEPSTLGLMGAGLLVLGGIGFSNRRRRQHA